MPDPDIVSRFDDIYSSTSKTVLAFITSKCKYTADISDIFQDTYMELYQVLSKRGAEYVTNDKAFELRLAKQKLARYYTLLERLQIFISMTAANEEEEEVELYDLEADAFLMEDFTINKSCLNPPGSISNRSRKA
ncbi:DNA-directed RNA polymerase specialized sigma24 family protein [Anaerotaenia torta]|uniref:hypothetical protein n=1 Tax=Anaerotaenia torta TaxID=433293 RepID=UPI003D23FE77